QKVKYKDTPEILSWYAYWIDPEGHKRTKAFGAGEAGRKAAEAYARKVADQLTAGTYQTNLGKTWAEFRRRYEETILSGYTRDGRDIALRCLDDFERLVGPKKMAGVTTEALDAYRAARRQEKNQRHKHGRPVAPGTVNLTVRVLRTALR